MPADPSALGTLPLPAFQHCEAMRLATGLGWYMFPPRTATLSFDGKLIMMAGEEGEWPLGSELVGEEFSREWNTSCPTDLVGQEIAWMTALNYPGIFQIWSGYFVETQPGWSLWIKPITNLGLQGVFEPFEGIVETDKFRPAHLFANFRFLKTDVPVTISAEEPLFHIVALPNAAFSPAPESTEHVILGEKGDANRFDWAGYLETTRSSEHAVPRGRYGAEMRKARRRQEQG